MGTLESLSLVMRLPLGKASLHSCGGPDNTAIELSINKAKCFVSRYLGVKHDRLLKTF